MFRTDPDKFYRIRYIIKGIELNYRGRFIKQEGDLIFLYDIKEGEIGLNEKNIVFVQQISESEADNHG